MPHFELYDYQNDYLDRAFPEASFLLADEMGLGKTVMVLAEVLKRSKHMEHMTVLIITPKSAISVWDDHIKWMFGRQQRSGLAVKVGGEHKKLQGVTTEDNIFFVVTNWDQLRLKSALKHHHWTYVIADEAHYAKNRKAKRSIALRHINGKFKRALTGTPIINRPDELWALLNWMFPQDYRSYWRFYERYVNYTQNQFAGGYKVVIGPKNVEELRDILREFTIRRLKKNVLKSLPDKYYTTLTVDLLPQQRRIYDEMKKEALAWVGEHESEPIPAPVAIAKLTRLRQFSSAYANITYDEDDAHMLVRMSEPSSKLDALMELLESNPDEQFVVFSQFKQMVRLAVERFKRADISYTGITGDTSSAKREENIAKFQAGKRRIFIATVQSGGVGITLTAASTCVFLDKSWSPAVNAQAEDRLHRIGQKSAVQIIRIDARNTVDQVVEERLQMKWKTIRAILEGT